MEKTYNNKTVKEPHIMPSFIPALITTTTTTSPIITHTTPSSKTNSNFFSCFPSIFQTLIIITCSFILLQGNDWLIPRRRCTEQEILLADPTKQPECFFHDTYEDARNAFKNEIKSTNGQLQLVSFPIYTQNGTLYIDVGYRIGKNASNILIIVSGTHGVEGYAGSALQLASIRSLNTRNIFKTSTSTIVFIHILNPYGMKYNRRTNENNVDLNRNAVFSDDVWKEITSRPDNIAGYVDYNDIFNPIGEFNFYHLLPAAWNMLTSGRFDVDRIKRAAVTGTHSNPKGVYYSGSKLEPSHLAIASFFKSYGLISIAKRVIIVDVHSGLGPQGLDSWMLYGDQLSPKLKEIVQDTYSGLPKQGSIISKLNETDSLIQVMGVIPYALEFDYVGISSGYDLVISDVQKGYVDLFKNHVKSKNGWAFCYSQEFGTVASIYVLNSVVVENAAYFYGNEEDLKRARKQTKAAFYPDNSLFAREVVFRGVAGTLRSLQLLEDGDE